MSEGPCATDPIRVRIRAGAGDACVSNPPRMNRAIPIQCLDVQDTGVEAMYILIYVHTCSFAYSFDYYTSVAQEIGVTIVWSCPHERFTTGLRPLIRVGASKQGQGQKMARDWLNSGTNGERMIKFRNKWREND